MPSHYGPKITTNKSMICRLDAADKNSYIGTGTTWTDLTGNGHSATLQSQGSFSSTLAQGTMSSGAGSITINANSVFTAAKSFEVWFRINNFPANSTFDSIWQHANNWNQQTGKGMHLIYGNLTWAWGQSWGGCCQIAISSLSTNTWYHAIGTSDGTTGTNKCKFYLNGHLKDTGTAANIPSDNPNIQIGNGNGGTIDGVIACWSAYADELSGTEVYDNYIALKSRFE